MLHYKLGLYQQDKYVSTKFSTTKLNLLSVFRYHEVLKKLYKDYGPLVREKIGSKTIVHVFDPDDIQTVGPSLLLS